MHIVIIMKRGSHLLHIVGTLRFPGGFPGLLYRRQQESDQHSNDGDDYQQLNQSEAG